MRKKFELSVPQEFTGVTMKSQLSITVSYFKDEPMNLYTVEVMPEIAQHIFWCERFDKHIKAAIMNNNQNS